MGLWGKRIFFFIITNIIIVLTLSFVASIAITFFGVQAEGITLYLIMYSIIGMGGAFISLWLSKWQAVRMMGVKIISETDSNPEFREIVRKVHHLSTKAGLKVKPEVGVYNSPEVNAFATGPSKNKSLVAVSTGLLEHMNEYEVEGVLAHEIAHIVNGDMVTMSLVMGVVNVMVMLVARLLTQVVINAVFRGRRSFFIELLIWNFFTTILYIPGSMLVSFFSRWREFRADRGGASLAGRDKMISALQSLSQITRQKTVANKEYSYLMISNKSSQSWFLKLFSSHPPLEDRIKRLQRERLS